MSGSDVVEPKDCGDRGDEGACSECGADVLHGLSALTSRHREDLDRTERRAFELQREVGGDDRFGGVRGRGVARNRSVGGARTSVSVRMLAAKSTSTTRSTPAGGAWSRTAVRTSVVR